MEPILVHSNKNALQEYYQREFPRWGSDGKQILPVYDHHRSDQGWVCTLKLPEGGEFQATARNKKDADQDAASQALKALLGGTANPIQPTENAPLWSATPRTVIPRTVIPSHVVEGVEFRLPGCVLVLIDLENSPGFNRKRWMNVRWDCSQVEAFVGKLSSHATKDLKSLYPYVNKFHIVNSGMKDAVDHAISVRAGQWLESMKHPKYYLEGEEGCLYDDCIFIVSRDRFAPALVDVLQQQLPRSEYQGGRAPGVIHSININECFGVLEEKSAKYK